MKYTMTDETKDVFAYEENKFDVYQFIFGIRKWKYVGPKLMDIMMGYDASEAGTPYSIGCTDRMQMTIDITKEEAEKIIKQKIDEEIFSKLPR